jgi:hypothetical protein
MAWSTPLTAVANSALTAAQWNASVRDNLLETGPAKATTAGRLIVTNGANAIVEREVKKADISTSQTTTSSSFTDLATPGPTVTVTTGTKALVFASCQMANSGANSVTQMSVAVSGATTIAASQNDDLYNDGLGAGNANRATVAILFDALTAGSNTFKMQYRVAANTGTFYDRSLIVMAL